MATGYSKEMLIDAYVTRYTGTGDTTKIKSLAEAHYDKVGKDAFRVAASLDAQAIREYKSRPKLSWSQAIQKLS